MVELISPMPGMKTRISPGSPLLTMRSTASAACSEAGRSSNLVQVSEFHWVTLALRT